MKRDALGDRMKAYENISRTYLPRRIPVIIRLDGKAFHTFTRGLEKPFDEINRICASKSVAFPYGFGCGLADGDWATVERLMVHRLWNCDVKIYLKE